MSLWCVRAVHVCVWGASSWIVLTSIKRHTRYPISFLAFFNLRKKKITEQVCSRAHAAGRGSVFCGY